MLAFCLMGQGEGRMDVDGQTNTSSQGDAGTGRQKGQKRGGAMLIGGGLSDGGLGQLALSLHTKTEQNRREFFEVYRRTARQVYDMFLCVVCVCARRPLTLAHWC